MHEPISLRERVDAPDGLDEPPVFSLSARVHSLVERTRVPVDLRSEEPAVDLRLGGSPAGEEAGWSQEQAARWLLAFLTLGMVLRLVRLALNHPLWNDEAYLALNILERDYAGLTRPLDYAQVCPLLFLWAEKAVIGTVGFSEWALRIVPTVASLASLLLFRHVAGRLLSGVALVAAVAILAVGYTPIRHGGEVKPYATDFFFALALTALAVEWLRTPGRVRFLWGLAALGPVALAASNPAIFVAATVGLVLATPVLKTRKLRAVAPLAVFGVATAGTFLVLLKTVNGPQSDHVHSWMQLYWASSFPPLSPGKLLVWLGNVHTSQMFAYPAGGDHGASVLTTGLVVAAILAYFKRGSRTVLALLLGPFALGLVAAALRRYPYGGTARTMQYVAPAINLLAGLGAAVLLARLRRPVVSIRSRRYLLGALVAIGVGSLVWDVTHPYKLPFYKASRGLARRFWAEESRDAELLCAFTDLKLPLDPLRWQADRAVMYRCQQAIYSPRHVAHEPARPERVSPSHPLRVVVFNETPAEAATLARWLRSNAARYTLRNRRERVLNAHILRGRRSFGDRYVIYELVPTTPEAGRPPSVLAAGS